MKTLTRFLVAILFALVLAASAFAQQETYRSDSLPLGDGFEIQLVEVEAANKATVRRFVLVKFPDVYLTPARLQEGMQKALVMIFTCEEFIDCQPKIETTATLFPDTGTVYRQYVDLKTRPLRIVIFPLHEEPDLPDDAPSIGVSLTMIDKPLKS